MSKNKDSLFRTKVKKTVKGYFIFYITSHLVVILSFFITGMIGFANNSALKVFIWGSLPPVFIFPFISWMIPGSIYYNKIRELLNDENEEELLRLANVKYNWNRGSIALCALFDLNPEIVRPILDKYHTRTAPSRYDLGFIKLLTKKVLEWESQELISPQNNSKLEPAIKITKTYFIKDKSDLGKGMITKTQLTMDYDIVICPYCGNMAKKELLADWLKSKKTCPICSFELSIDDCPIVDIGNN